MKCQLPSNNLKLTGLFFRNVWANPTLMAVVQDQKKLNKIRALANKELSAEELAKVEVLDVEGLFTMIQAMETARANEESVVKGYNVKVQYQGLASGDMEARRSAVSRIVMRSLKKSDEKK